MKHFNEANLGNIVCHVPSMGNYYVYSVHDLETDRMLYAGYGRYADVLTFKTLIKNPAFNVQGIYRLKLHSQHTNYVQAGNAVGVTINLYYGDGTPPLNMTSGVNRYSSVLCEQSGAKYQNASVCSKALGISQARLSMHLARKPGHKSIKGLTFRYVNYADAIGKPDPVKPTLKL